MTDFFKAMGDPTRREILELLKERDLTPSDILEKIKIAQPTLSHHLDILKRARLIEGEREGQFIRYALNMGVFELGIQHLMSFVKRR